MLLNVNVVQEHSLSAPVVRGRILSEDMTDVCVRLKRQMDIMIKVMLMYLP